MSAVNITQNYTCHICLNVFTNVASNKMADIIIIIIIIIFFFFFFLGICFF